MLSGCLSHHFILIPSCVYFEIISWFPSFKLSITHRIVPPVSPKVRTEMEKWRFVLLLTGISCKMSRVSENCLQRTVCFLNYNKLWYSQKYWDLCCDFGQCSVQYCGNHMLCSSDCAHLSRTVSCFRLWCQCLQKYETFVVFASLVSDIVPNIHICRAEPFGYLGQVFTEA